MTSTAGDDVTRRALVMATRLRTARLNQRHEMQVFRDNALLRTMDVSTGKPGWETRNGTKVLMEKVAGKTWTNEAIDAPEDYRLYSQFAMRLTNSGEFIHDAPWNLRNIGRASTSHGCVGMTPSDMTWLFSRSMVGAR